jgi:hypothetical protein
MSRSMLLAAWKRGTTRGLQFLFIIVASSLTVPFHAPMAQTDGSWDGVWRGKWDAGATTSVTIKDGRVVEYRFLDRTPVITDSAIAGDTMTFRIPGFQYSLSRTGPARAAIQARSDKGELSTGIVTKEGAADTTNKGATTQSSAPSAAKTAAPQCQLLAESWVNSSGYRITGYTARVEGSGCVGGQNYVKIDNPTDSGVSPRRWSKNATQSDGSVRCSGGTWYRGGPGGGQPGGREPDVVIREGKIYRCN